MLEDLKYSAEELVKWIREVAPRYEEYEFNNDLDTTLEKYFFFFFIPFLKKLD